MREAVSDVVELLQSLIRFRTVNPPGDEAACAAFVARELERAGVETEVIETAPSRAAVIGRVRGSGAARPVLLLSHLDVVGVELDKWTVDPFEGVVRDGYVVGRGAIDDKGMLAANIVAMQRIAHAVAGGDVLLDRDVVFMATPDEESVGTYGIDWLARQRPELFDAEYALNEGGRIRIGTDATRTALIQVAEKVSHMATLTARGVSGHAGVPRPDNAIVRLGRALAAISDYVSDPAHGVSPTLLEAGFKTNVIPDVARATLNVRTAPSASVDEVLTELARRIADPAVEVVLVERGEGSPASPPDTPMYDAIAGALRDADPSLLVASYVSAGATDSSVLRRLGVFAYGLLPFPLDADDEGRMHGADERVPVDALRFGTDVVHDAVLRIAARRR